MRPKRHSGGREDGLLHLLRAYLRDSRPFARPGPPPAEPLPLKFTCTNCGSPVNPANGKCSGCRSTYEFGP